MVKFRGSLNQRLLDALQKNMQRPALFEEDSMITHGQLADRVASCSHRIIKQPLANQTDIVYYLS